MEVLIKYAIEYKEYYEQPINPIFHTACSCVTSQQVKFSVGRSIRKDLYELCGFPLTRQSILNADLSKIKNLTHQRITLLKQMAEIDDNRDNINVINDYSKLNGFGKWSYGAVCILMGLNNDVNLTSDSYIRKNLSLYCGQKMTEKECFNYIFKSENNQTSVCYLLWRIKPDSIIKIKKNEILTKNDFV